MRREKNLPRQTDTAPSERKGFPWDRTPAPTCASAGLPVEKSISIK